MKNISTLAIGITLVASSALASTTHQPDSKVSKKSDAPQGYVFVEEEVSLNLNRLPTLFMNSARVDFLNKNYGEASSDMKAASQALEAQSKQTISSDAAADLKAACKDANQLSSDIKIGTLISVDALDSRMAKIIKDKSQGDRRLAITEWNNQNYRSVGYDLQQASDELDQATSWSVGKIDESGRASRKAIHEVSRKLIKGEGWTHVEVEKSLKDLGSELNRFDSNQSKSARNG